LGRISHRIESQLGNDFQTLLLVGALARGEGTYDPQGRLLSDADFLIVLPQRYVATALMAEFSLRTRMNRIKGISDPDEGWSIGFANAVPRFWRMATPFMLELRENGRVLSGDGRVKQWPAISLPHQIPAWEGIRLVANRVCELLSRLGTCENGDIDRAVPRERWELAYACIKLLIACSEALLIETGCYRASYQDRFHQHKSVASVFTKAENEIILKAYGAKLNQAKDLLNRDLKSLVVQSLSLGITTVQHFGLHQPEDFKGRILSESPIAPGWATDYSFFVRRSLLGKKTPIRRAIANIYAEAFRLAQDLVERSDPFLMNAAVRPSCRRLGEAFRATPQAVGMIPGRGSK
jgi:hypothetical protein